MAAACNNIGKGKTLPSKCGRKPPLSRRGRRLNKSIPGLECAETRENDCVTTQEPLTRNFLELLLWQHLKAATSSEKEHYHGQDDLKSAAPFFNQSNCVIYALIQSEMEPQTLGPSVRDNAIFKTM